MEIIIPLSTIKFQFISLYDRTIFHFVERVTQHLRESIHVILEESINNSHESVTLGDIIPDNYLSTKSRHFVYLLQDYSDVEDIILQLNKDIFGEDLIEIPDTENDIVVKFVY
jgi:hypothetical protein